MAKFNHPLMAELTHQLTLSPTRLRLKQLDAAEHLVQLIEPEKNYPYDFVCHRITGYRPKHGVPQRGMLGKTLIEDVVQLVEELSAASPIAVEIMPTACWSTEELAERLKVSTKTICRWRRRGLVGRRLRYSDGSIRMAFPEPAVRRFVTAHHELVKRGAAFKQLTAAEKQRIVTLARETLSERRVRLHELSQEIATRVGRAVETVRYTLRRYDQAHPEDALFGRDDQPLIRPELRAIYDAVQSGDAPSKVGRKYGKSAGAVKGIVREVRTRLLKAREIRFIHNQEFESPAADARILNASEDADASEPKRIRPPRDLPPYLQELYRQPLLSPEQERNVFRRYNYLKFKAHRVRETLDVLEATDAQLERVESLLAEAERVKNDILKANLRLVVSIARRHAGKAPEFFETVSDGNLALMRAVEKFDYGRGFKFSTYASWAIMRNYARTVPEQMYQSARLVTGVEEVLSAAPSREDAERESVLEGVKHVVQKGLGLLTARERDVVVRHYGLGKDKSPMTLDQIGQLFGVTKERIRQIERKAFTKIRAALSNEGEAAAQDALIA